MKLEHIQIQTNNIKETELFYKDVLDLKILEKRSNSVTIQAGNSILKFIENPEFNSAYHFAFNIPENKLEERAANEGRLGHILKEMQHHKLITAEHAVSPRETISMRR